MRAQPTPKEKLTNDPYTVYPLAYLICEDGLALPPPMQEQMCQAKTADGCKLKVFKGPFDHSPTINAIPELTNMVIDFAAWAESA